MTNFGRALAFTLRWEGGYCNVPGDHGGATNRGVTQTTYDGWRSSQGLAQADVRGITDEEVEAIYRKLYWEVAHCDGLAWPLCLAAFDAAVNSGPVRAVKWLQMAAGVAVDGRWGPSTRAAVAAGAPRELAHRALDHREAFLRRISQNPGQAQFLRGWLNRTAGLRAQLDEP